MSLIDVRNLSVRYGETFAVRDLSFSLQEKESLGLVGESGSGKSTLIRCINQLEKHESGHIFVDGVELKVRSNRRDTTRARVGMVFQQFNLFPHLTVIENLMLGPIRAKKMSKTAAEKLAMQFLDRVHIPEQAKKYSRQLSGGQQQRVAIARSLCMEPEILLFDEPTSALDPEMISEVLEVMVDLAQSGITMICVTHEMGFARKVADRMVFMDHGEIVEASPPEKFFNTPDSERCQSFLQKILHH